ncbi:MAG: hypothetical protein OXH15_01075 [Gammaproteobacteria bacterium]|nr:hypothetical protein [Gammaproteobacteria bacterium]
MSKAFESVFDVERPVHAVWEACRLPTDDAHPGCRIPGFPSLDGQPGCAATVIDSAPQQLLRVRKDDEPCAGTEIVIQVSPATAGGWPTRVSVRQSGFAPWLLAAGDVVEAHWRHIVADFHLYLVHEVTVPGTVWGEIGAALRQTPIGLEIANLTDGGLARRCGMQCGDVLLTMAGIRIQTIEQLWTVLAFVDSRRETAIAWVRDGRRMTANSVPG